MEQVLDVVLPVPILPQPDDTTCGPTCLHAVYRYYGDDCSLDEVIESTRTLDQGGTLAVFLACAALRRGYAATIYTYNLQVFDPSWFTTPGVDLAGRLRRQAEAKQDPKLNHATEGYLEFLQRGGSIRFVDLTRRLLRANLRKGRPILTGLSSTYLYQSPRLFGEKDDYDDVRGSPGGHFVILNGYHREGRTMLVTDPYRPNPLAPAHVYQVNIDRVICSILLGVLTYDANLLIIQPRKPKAR